MPRSVRDAKLETRTARAKLAIQGKPHFRALDPGLHLGYRRGLEGGSWSVRMYIGDGNYQLTRIGVADDMADADGVAVMNFTQAQAAARRLFVSATRSTAGAPQVSSGPYTVAMAMDDYIAWLENEGRDEVNINDARSKSRAHILPKLGDVRLDRLTAHQVQSWLHALPKAPPRRRAIEGTLAYRKADMGDAETRRRRRSSANRMLSILKAALNKAWRDHKVVDDKPWRSVPPFPNVTASRARWLSQDECRRLINASETDFRDLARAGLHTGCRFGELCRLTAVDFNEDAGTIAVRKSKSAKPRHVVLTDEGVAFFAHAVVKAKGRAVLFCRADGVPWKIPMQQRPMEAASKAARLVPRATFHALRHTYASHAIQNAVPLLVVARNLGHRDTRMIELHYGHLAPSYEVDAMRRGALRFEGGRDRVVTPMRRKR
jgi:integrase